MRVFAFKMRSFKYPFLLFIIGFRWFLDAFKAVHKSVCKAWLFKVQNLIMMALICDYGCGFVFYGGWFSILAFEREASSIEFLLWKVFKIKGLCCLSALMERMAGLSRL